MNFMRIRLVKFPLLKANTEIFGDKCIALPTFHFPKIPKWKYYLQAMTMTSLKEADPKI